MQLGETIATYDVALALRGESGKFAVTSPGGDIYQVTCKPNHSIVNLEWSGDASNSQPFLIRKVAEPVPSSIPEKTVDLTETPAQSRAAKTPFLIDMGDKGPEARETLHSTPTVTLADDKVADIENLDLLYQEAGKESGQPAACVCLRGESQHGPTMRLTNTCTSFNEFDVEIRRLHARLDDIRYRARKKFYEAQVIAAGA
jgi:hypothetical protein